MWKCYRYNELVQIHGKLDPLVNIDLTPESKVQVKIICGDKCEQHILDVYQTVSELKQKLEKFSGIPAHRMRVFYMDQHVCSVIGPEEMKFPNKRLYSYNIVKGDQIIVDSKKWNISRTDEKHIMNYSAISDLWYKDIKYTWIHNIMLSFVIFKFNLIIIFIH